MNIVKPEGAKTGFYYVIGLKNNLRIIKMRSKVHLWRLDISCNGEYSQDNKIKVVSLKNLAMPEKSFFAKLFTNGETVEEILQYVSNKQIWTKNIRLASVFEDGKQWPKI
jgi:hypothetical protein